MIYDTFYAKLVPNGAVTGTKYSVSISGVTAIVDGQKTYTGADMYFAITPKSSGNATVTFRNDTDGDVIGTRPILIRSTTLAVPTYTLTASATSVNEGGTVTFSIDTSDVPVGTNIAYVITGVSVADISLGSLTGNFVVSADGSADLPITITNDALSEGTETLTLTLTGKGLSKAVTINDTSLATTYAVGVYGTTSSSIEITEAYMTSPVYARITPTNGVSGDKFSVTVTGITATVDAQKTWTSGSLNFAIIPKSSGTATVTFKNDTKNVTIGTRTFVSKPNNSATFISEYYSDSSQQLWGYTFNTNLGTELTDNIKINDVLVDLGICDFSTNVAGTGNGILSVWVAATVSFNYNVIKAKCTNTSSGLTYTSVAMQPILVGPNGTGWFADVADADLTKLKTIFADGQTVRLELILE